jgi:hypothetical protein
METGKVMKRFLRKDILIITGLTLLSGCGNFLSENPDNRVELNTTEKAAQLLTNAYSSAGYNFTEWMGDNVSWTTGTTKLTEHNQSYNWEDITSVNQDTPTNFWTSTYDAIAHANEVLAVIDKLPGDDAKKDAVRGEAYLTRAYGHFMLVNLFALHYDEEDAEFDLGIPYITTPETEFIKKYNRNTVQEVYDLIEEDLENGLKYVDASYYQNSGKYHFTKDAALAFASRFYLFKGDIDNCIKYSTQMLGNSPASYVKDIVGLLRNMKNAEDYIGQYSSPTEKSNLLSMRHITNFPVNVGYWPDIPLTNRIYDNNPWRANDIRNPTALFDNETASIPAYIRGNGLTIAKYEFLFERSSLTSNVGLYYTIFTAFRGEEVLLNRAESYLYKNNLNAAIADLQVLVNMRYQGNRVVTLTALRNYYGSTNNQVNLINFIIDERQKEFLHEGLRWFDIKRYGLQVVHILGNNVPITLGRNDDRKVLQIPQAAIDVGGLEPNPR